ncbi:MAG: response regulator transcription factor [Saprospiraceae bacterium]|nr:response regulator transcription factor [Saprospiraceae bacterium]
MKTYKILLVDDEFLALNLLEQFAKELPDLELVGKCKSPIQALDILQKEPIDILFLDIQMPVLSGTNLLKTLQRPPATIFTTAYSEHAVEAFDLNAVDYLLKPFSFERFLQAVNKAKDFLNKNAPPQYAPNLEQTNDKKDPENVKDYMVAKVDGRIEKIFFNDIQYVEGLKEYVKVVCSSRSYVILESMKNLEDNLLPSTDFMRVHKSYIVAKKRVQTLEGNQLDVGGKIKIPISRERKDEVVKTLFGI